MTEPRDRLPAKARAAVYLTGKPPRGWLGPGPTETWEAPDL